MPSPNSRTLVFSFDGTGNELLDATGFKLDESISNVLKLHILMGGGLEEDRSATLTAGGDLQETRYSNGIGTREDGETIPLVGELIAKTRRFINCALAPSRGDARRITFKAMRDLEALVPRPDNRIVVLGLSRGALPGTAHRRSLFSASTTLSQPWTECTRRVRRSTPMSCSRSEPSVRGSREPYKSRHSTRIVWRSNRPSLAETRQLPSESPRSGFRVCTAISTGGTGTTDSPTSA